MIKKYCEFSFCHIDLKMKNVTMLLVIKRKEKQNGRKIQNCRLYPYFG